MEHASEFVEPPLIPRLPSERVPLTFCQQKWLESFHAGTHNLRECTTAVRVSGQLDTRNLRQSLSEVVRRHESLRTRIVESHGAPAQEIDNTGAYDLSVVDLSASPAVEVEDRAKLAVDKFVNTTFDVMRGPLFAMRLVKLNAHNHILVLAMDQMISDGFSMNILLRDVWTLYSQFVSGSPLSLPEMPVQFGDYAIWQRKACRWWISKYGKYWEDRLTKAPRVPFPADTGIGASAPFKPARASVQLSHNVCSGLRRLSCRQHTTLPLVMLATYVATILRWQEKWELVVEMIVHGRNRLELLNVIGYVGSTLYLRIELKETDSFLDFLQRVTEEFCTAYEHHRLGYIPVRSGDAELTGITCFNWTPPSLFVTGEVPSFTTDAGESPEGIRLEPFLFTQTAMDGERSGAIEEIIHDDPVAMFSETGHGVSCTLVYISTRFRSATMEGFVQNFRAFAGTFLENPQVRVAMIRYK